MPLDTTQLSSNLLALFQAAYDQNYDKKQVADQLASVIDTFVRTADITGVKVDVQDVGGANLIGRGTQSNTVKLG